jgi:hypothetical protein
MAVDADLGLHSLQKFERLLGLLGLVTLIVLPESLIRGYIHNDCFYRGGTDIEADQVLRVVVVRLVIVLDFR